MQDIGLVWSVDVWKRPGIKNQDYWCIMPMAEHIWQLANMQWQLDILLHNTTMFSWITLSPNIPTVQALTAAMCLNTVVDRVHWFMSTEHCNISDCQNHQECLKDILYTHVYNTWTQSLTHTYLLLPPWSLSAKLWCN